MPRRKGAGMVLADVHSHILYGVDDGAKSKEDSFAMLDSAYKSGVRVAFATPHYDPELFKYDPSGEERAFNELTLYSKEKYPDLRLYKGNEIYVYSGAPSILSEGKGTVEKAGMVLIEFSADVTSYGIVEAMLEIKALGYGVIIAHVERYKSLTVEEIAMLKDRGAVITVNASSVIGKNGGGEKRMSRRLIEYGIADAVASDAHASSEYGYLAKAYGYVLKKYGSPMAERLFWSNVNNLIIKES